MSTYLHGAIVYITLEFWRIVVLAKYLESCSIFTLKAFGYAISASWFFFITCRGSTSCLEELPKLDGCLPASSSQFKVSRKNKGSGAGVRSS
jgi:hypothetical protein